MNKRILIILFCITMCLVGIVYSYTTQKDTESVDINTSTPDTTRKNIQENKEQTNTINSVKNNDVVLTQKGPDRPHKRGTVIQIPYTITNNGNTVYNVLVISNNGYDTKSIGVLKPGQTKKYAYKLYIPTDKDEFSELNPANPWEVGVIHATFKDDKGVVHRVTSNSIEIKWFD